jgi:hypothetical protein
MNPVPLYLFLSLIPFLALVIVMLLIFNRLLKSHREQMAAMIEQMKLSTERFKLEKSLASQKQTLAVRLQAYERLVLFLERIQPSSLVMRGMDESGTTRQLQSVLLRTIREEFEHNLSQQLYISTTAWSTIKAAREEVSQLINLTASKIGDGATKDELARALVVKNTSMAEEALRKLKAEVADLYE